VLSLRLATCGTRRGPTGGQGEGQPDQSLELIAAGDTDDTMPEAPDDLVKRRRKRLASGTKLMSGGGGATLGNADR